MRLPGGMTATVDVVRHRGSVVLIPQPATDEVVLIRQYRPVLKKWIWELPAGSLDPGERPGPAARRECEEEIGLRPGRIEKLGAFYATPGFCDERMIFYRCTNLVRPRRPRVGDEDERITPRTFTLDDAWTLVERGLVVDMKTVIGLVLIGAGTTGTRRRRSPPLREPKPRS